MSNILYIIGIDPGVTTGFALWSCEEKKLINVESDIAYGVELRVLNLVNKYGSDALFIRVEDARQRDWFGNSGTERWKGAGSVMRDCGRWEELLKAEGLAFEMVSPKRNRTKLDAVRFGQYTGWQGKTNEHARDAGMLVFGYTPTIAKWRK